jgi:hypothetical protein
MDYDYLEHLNQVTKGLTSRIFLRSSAALSNAELQSIAEAAPDAGHVRIK